MEAVQSLGGDEAEAFGDLVLVCNKEVQFATPHECATLSSVYNSQRDGCEHKLENMIIKVDKLFGTTRALFHVTEFLLLRKGENSPSIQKPLKANTLEECEVPKVNIDFITKVVGLRDQEGYYDLQLLYEVLISANYIGIDSLVNLCSAQLAVIARSGDPQYVKVRLSLPAGRSAALVDARIEMEAVETNVL